jgi:hypothetical protein
LHLHARTSPIVGNLAPVIMVILFMLAVLFRKVLDIAAFNCCEQPIDDFASSDRLPMFQGVGTSHKLFIHLQQGNHYDANSKHAQTCDN